MSSVARTASAFVLTLVSSSMRVHSRNVPFGHDKQLRRASVNVLGPRAPLGVFDMEVH